MKKVKSILNSFRIISNSLNVLNITVTIGTFVGCTALCVLLQIVVQKVITGNSFQFNEYCLSAWIIQVWYCYQCLVMSFGLSFITTMQSQHSELKELVDKERNASEEKRYHNLNNDHNRLLQYFLSLEKAKIDEANSFLIRARDVFF